MEVRTITSLAMLAAIAYVVMYLSKMLPQVLGFLQFDLKDTVICVGGFIFGPLAAAIISLVVPLLEMFTVSDTGIIGCIMNVLATVAFCCTATFVYKKVHTGIILAKNEPAKAFGVKTAETIWQARKKCPDLVLLPAHHGKYREFSRQVNGLYQDYTDLVEPFGIDESWLT